MILTEILESAIGSGDDVGSLNLKHLKQLISNILTQMNIGHQNAEEVTSDNKNGDKDRLEDLEDKIKQLGKHLLTFTSCITDSPKISLFGDGS